MASIGDWDEILDERNFGHHEAIAERFVGRDRELNAFRKQISLIPPRYLIYYISGQGGVGKTALLDQYREITRNLGFLVTRCNEQQRDVTSVLDHFARQLAEQGFPLKHFTERYKIYGQMMDEIHKDPEAPQGLAALFGRTLVRAAFISGDLLPGVRRGLEYLPKEAMEAQASEWADYLAKKLTNKDEVALIREPISILTTLFFEELNEVAREKRVILFFDSFEVTRQDLQDWLLGLREYKPSLNIRIVIAGRDQPGANWDALRSVMMRIHLEPFTEQEAEVFLNTVDIQNPKRRTEILEYSSRLPVLMSWLAAPEAQEPDLSIPTHDLVERFLRWITEPALRQVALLGAIPRTFNLDVLQLLLKNQAQVVDEQFALDWLKTMSFVQQHSNSWKYHEVVRRMMLSYQRQISPQTYRQTHMILAEFYNTRCNQHGLPNDEHWANEQWRIDMLAYVYHFLIVDHIKHWSSVISLFTVALRKRRTFAIEIIELLDLEDVRDELDQEQSNIVQLFRQQLQAINSGNLQSGFEMFQKLCSLVGLSPEAQGYALSYRGACFRLHEKWEEAFRDFKNALHYIPNDTWTIAGRGETYHIMRRYQEALADFDQAIALDRKDPLVIASRGLTYREMGRYQEALADFNKAVSLDKKDILTLVNRGITYRKMGRYNEALRDFDQAIGVDKKNILALINRGITYREMGRYEDALKDFDQAMALSKGR